MNRAEFEHEFHSKTVGYQPRFRLDSRPVVVDLRAAVDYPSGHWLASALTNLLARAHTRIVFIGDLERPLLTSSPFGHETLLEATAGLATQINPYVDVDVVEVPPRSPALARLSLGREEAGTLGLGSNGWIALLGREASLDEEQFSHLGASLAACLGAWFAFQRLVGDEVMLAEQYSLWNWSQPGLGQGPPFHETLDLGRVLQVGAGGVGAALAYWLGWVQLGGRWLVADGDTIDVSNLNRQLIYLAADVGYPEGRARLKAPVCAERMNTAASSNAWWGEEEGAVNNTYDVVLALANERGARGALQDRQPPVLLHATTSPNYQAQLHRHLGGADDCIRCRLPGPAPRLACSEVVLPDGEGDAALPFLSGLAGLLLLASLIRLERGQLAGDPRNLTIVDLAGQAPVSQRLRLRCRSGCRGWGSLAVRRAAGAGTRYADLVEPEPESDLGLPSAAAGD